MMTRSAPATAAAGSSWMRSRKPSSQALSRVLALRAVPATMAGQALAPDDAGERGADQADADQRHAVEQRFARSCRGHLGARPGRSAKRRHRPRLGLGADGDAQAMAKTIGPHLAQDQAAATSGSASALRRHRRTPPAGNCRRWDARDSPVSVSSALSQARQFLLWAARLRHMLAVVERGERRGLGRRRGS